MRTLWLIVVMNVYGNLCAWEINQTKLLSGKIISFERAITEEKIYDSLMNFCYQNKFPQEDAQAIVYNIINGPLTPLFTKKFSTLSSMNKAIREFCKQELFLKEASADIIEKIQVVVKEADLEKIRKTNLRLSRQNQKISSSLLPLPLMHGPEEDVVRRRGGMSMQDIFPGGDDDLLS